MVGEQPDCERVSGWERSQTMEERSQTNGEEKERMVLEEGKRIYYRGQTMGRDKGWRRGSAGRHMA